MGLAASVPQEISISGHNERSSSPFDHQSILMKYHFMGTAEIV